MAVVGGRRRVSGDELIHELKVVEGNTFKTKREREMHELTEVNAAVNEGDADVSRRGEREEEVVVAVC